MNLDRTKNEQERLVKFMRDGVSFVKEIYLLKYEALRKVWVDDAGYWV